MVSLSICISIFIAYTTYKVIELTKMTPTRVSSSTTLISFAILYGLNKVVSIDLTNLMALIFGATFVGMCSHKIFSARDIIFAAIIYSLVFTFVAPSQYGIGGALGFSAFSSLVLIWTLKKSYYRLKEY